MVNSNVIITTSYYSSSELILTVALTVRLKHIFNWPPSLKNVLLDYEEYDNLYTFIIIYLVETCNIYSSSQKLQCYLPHLKRMFSATTYTKILALNNIIVYNIIMIYLYHFFQYYYLEHLLLYAEIVIIF